MATPRKKVVKEVAVAEEIKAAASTEINYNLLQDIVKATQERGFINITHDDLNALEVNGYIECNLNVETKDGFAWRASEKGINYFMVAPNKTEKKIAVKHNFEVGSFDLNNVPAKEKGKRGRTSKYDFDSLTEINLFIFVPDAEVKKVNASVIAHNNKYAVATGETREVSRKPKGGTEKVTKNVPVMAFTKEFKVYPYTLNGVNGSAIVRIK
jgi:hypothetical protein